MKGLTDINEAGHSFAPGYGHRGSLASIEEWVFHTFGLNTDQQLLVLGAVMAMLFLRSFLKVFRTRD